MSWFRTILEPGTCTLKPFSNPVPHCPACPACFEEIKSKTPEKLDGKMSLGQWHNPPTLGRAVCGGAPLAERLESGRRKNAGRGRRGGLKRVQAERSEADRVFVVFCGSLLVIVSEHTFTDPACGSDSFCFLESGAELLQRIYNSRTS